MSEPGNRPFALSSVPVTFLSVMALLVIALGWLGWLLLEQDRSLEKQRTRERVDAAAAELETAFSEGIHAQRSRLDEVAESVSSGRGAEVPATLERLRGPLTVIHFSVGGTTVAPKRDLLYLAVPGEPEPLPSEFARADRLEFQQQDFAGAMRLLAPFAARIDAVAVIVILSGFILLGIVSLALDRRVPLVSVLLYLGISIGYLFASVTVQAAVTVGATLLLLGAIVVTMGLAWRRLRRALLGPLGRFAFSRKLPPLRPA